MKESHTGEATYKYIPLVTSGTMPILLNSRALGRRGKPPHFHNSPTHPLATSPAPRGDSCISSSKFRCDLSGHRNKRLQAHKPTFSILVSMIPVYLLSSVSRALLKVG